MRDLLDASVWVPLGAPDHVHHRRARQYWDHEAGEELVFCRLVAFDGDFQRYPGVAFLDLQA